MPKESLAEVTASPELGTTSEAEQMYLITVARAVEVGTEGPIPLSKIAVALGVSVPSANEMVRKLESKGLLIYEPYRGALLSDTGRSLANQVLRTRRLWATFLADHLGFGPSEADDQACHLEHATTAEAADRLATFLGNPTAGPLGRPIPGNGTPSRVRRTVKLADLPVGVPAEVISVSSDDASLDFLRAEGITVGVQVTVVGAGRTGLLIEFSGGSAHLSTSLGKSIDVNPLEGRRASA
jgi:DtxR family transcriptional regulator, Mn-dependent transcriptional regulator